VVRIFEIVLGFSILIILLVEEIKRDMKVIWIVKKIFISIFFIIMSSIFTITTISYITESFYVPWTIGNICLLLGSILLVISTILVIKDRLKEKPEKEDKTIEKKGAFSNYKKRKEELPIEKAIHRD
jgi:DNA integrity scanning protein DisA with diadenylate cyclase activity